MLEHPTQNADTQYIWSLAQMTSMVVTKLNNQLINQRLEPGGISHIAPGGDSHVVQIQDGTYLSSAMSGTVEPGG
jgi:hypothetical protein